MKKCIIISMLNFALLYQLAFSQSNWSRNTFPGQGYYDHGYPEGAGMDRSPGTRAFFATSPSDPSFMILSDEMGGTVLSKSMISTNDGSVPYFEPLNVPFVGFQWSAIAAEFSKHDNDTLYFLAADFENGTDPSYFFGDGSWGLWKTTNRGDDWELIYSIPNGSYENKSRGKRTIMEDPSDTRSNHLYLGSTSRGLLRTEDNGANWVSVYPELANRAIRTMDGGVDANGDTVLYVIAGLTMPAHQLGQPNPAYWLEPNITDAKIGYTATWEFEGNGYDWSGNQYNLLFSDTADYRDETMDKQYSLYFDGLGQNASIQNLVYDRDDYVAQTVTAWVRMDADDGNGQRVIASFDHLQYWQLGINIGAADPGQVVWQIRGADSNLFEVTSGAALVNDNKWHHVAATFERHSEGEDYYGIMRLYIDGVEVGSSLNELYVNGLLSSINETYPIFGSGVATSGYVGFGASGLSAWDELHFMKGNLDQLRIYPMALSEYEISGLAHGFSDPFYVWNPCFVSQGELYKIVVDDDSSTVTQLYSWLQDFVDVAVDPADPHRGFVLRKPYSGLGDSGGRELWEFNSVTAGLDHVKTAPGVSRYGSININPSNPNHLVMLTSREVDMTGKLIFSTDRGLGWQQENRSVATVNGYPFCPSIQSYTPVTSHTYQSDGSGGAPVDNLFEVTDFSDISFIPEDPTSVLWSSVSLGLLRSADSGVTFAPYGAGGTNKDTYQIAVSSDGQNIMTGMLEYGFVRTDNGGLYWSASDSHSDPVFYNVAHNKFSGTYGEHMGYGVGINQDAPTMAAVAYTTESHILATVDGGETFWDLEQVSAGKRVFWTDNAWLYIGDQLCYNAGEDIIAQVSNGSIDHSALQWVDLDYNVVAVSAENPRVIVGVAHPAAPDDPDWMLQLSIDSGNNWVGIKPDPEFIPGTETAMQVIGMGDVWGGESPHMVSIDPDPARDPAGNPTLPMRLLVAGRSGIYAYEGSSVGNVEDGTWTIHREGIADSMHFDVDYRDVEDPLTDPHLENAAPYMGFVCFDPRPGHHNTVYAAKTMLREKLGNWANPDWNANCRYGRGAPDQPFYRSIDGGITWTSLHSDEFPGELPDYTDTFEIYVDMQGSFHASTPQGLFTFKPARSRLENVSHGKLLQATATPDETGGGAKNARCVDTTVLDESTEWYLKPVGDGTHFYIVSVESGLFLETTNTPDESWVKTKAVRLVSANSDFSVQWRKEDIGSGEFMLKNREYGRFLQCSPSVDLDTGSSEGGRQIRAHNSQLNMAKWREIALEE